MPNGQDHDLLIKIATNVEGICKSLEKFDKRIEQVECKVDDAVRLSWFKWIGSGTMTLIISAFVFFGSVIWQHHNALAEMSEVLSNHLYFSAAIYKKHTGIEWNNITRQELLDAKKEVEETWKESKKKK